ncbi:TRAP transporter small permease [Acidovorax sp. RAC01]|uniref:TRAP transporter small permease n=1 Tax=Acidovorax sp. RAC01 TaxID=1842533 RepID=UPI00083E7B9D|nr:TRAP transporter small permease [Acidovorax sp. RAC01]AOG24316.1 tripartite ATP-independent periplasmic transporter, DctQ component family protein [Acidovorax sp. RAC01]
MTRLISRICWLLDQTLAAMLALMVVLVFGNVVLRYAFNSGISVSEELSRWLFVWMTFMGAVVALHERAHLGTDMLVGRLGPAGRKVCLAISYLAMLGICWLIFRGSLDQTRINWETTSAVMEVPVAGFYACGVVFAVLASCILVLDLLRLLRGEMAESELQMFQESEERPHQDDTKAH